MANPYVGEGIAVAVEHDLVRLYAAGPGMGYRAYGAHGDKALPRIDGTRYVYRDGAELEAEREFFQRMLNPSAPD